MNSRSSTDHKGELLARAQAFLEELRSAAAAARERVFAGAVIAVQPPAPVAELPPARADADPIFATREFDVPQDALSALMDLDTFDRAESV